MKIFKKLIPTAYLSTCIIHSIILVIPMTSCICQTGLLYLVLVGTLFPDASAAILFIPVLQYN